jgi:hypothetical protein
MWWLTIVQAFMYAKAAYKLRCPTQSHAYNSCDT